MSAVWAGITGAAAGWPASSRRPENRRSATGRARLRPVPAAAPRLARRPFALVLIVVFALGLTGLLMLNTTLQNQAFTARTLNQQATELAHIEADLETRLEQASSPREMVRQATLLGMRPDQHPAFLVLPSGTVIGKPTRVKGDEAENLLYKTEAQVSQEEADALARHEAKLAKRAAAVRSRALQDQALAIGAQEDKLRKARQDEAASKDKAAREKAARKKAASPDAAGSTTTRSSGEGDR